MKKLLFLPLCLVVFTQASFAGELKPIPTDKTKYEMLPELDTKFCPRCAAKPKANPSSSVNTQPSEPPHIVDPNLGMNKRNDIYPLKGKDGKPIPVNAKEGVKPVKDSGNPPPYDPLSPHQR